MVMSAAAGDDRVATVEDVDGWLGALGESFGVPLSLDDDGACAIAVEGGLDCVIEADAAAELVHLHALLLRLPVEGRAALIEEALALNLYGVVTEGASLGLDRDSDSLALAISRPLAELDHARFAALLTGFVGTALRLRDQLRQGEGMVEQPADSLPGANPGFMFRV
jgi:hypothetical protein